MTKDPQKIFDAMPNDISTEFFDNDNYVGINIYWSETGRGFGEYCFYVDKKTGEFSLDNENDRFETVKKVLDRMVDEHPEEVKKLFHQMLDRGFPNSEREEEEVTITLNDKPINLDEYK